MKRSAERDDLEARKLGRLVLRGSVVEARHALKQLLERSCDVHDIRVAQPAIDVALLADDVAVRRLAAAIVRERATQGNDVRLAFPALVRATRDEDAEVRRDAWTAIGAADSRHDTLIEQLRRLATAAVAEETGDVQAAARSVLERQG